MKALLPARILPARLRERLCDESGVALVMALGIMLVISIGVSASLEFTSSSGRHAGRSNAGQKAYALAEGGLNNAIAVLKAAGANPTVTTLLPTRTTCSNGVT